MSSPEDSLHEVLVRFHEEAQRITPELVRSWTEAYPQYASEIRAHAVERLDMEERAAHPVEEDDKADFSDLVRIAIQAAVERQSPLEVPGLRQVLEEHGSDVRELASRIDLARSVLADLASGQVVASTVPTRFLRLAAAQLGCAVEWFATVVAHSHDTAAVPAFKASRKPTTGRTRTWEEAVRASTMTDERKAFWLAPGD